MNLDDIVPSGSSSQRRRSSAAGSDVQREIGSLAHTMRERMNVEIPAGRGGLADRDRYKDEPAGMRGVARNESVYVTLPGVHAQTPRLLCLTGIFRRIPTAEEERGSGGSHPTCWKKGLGQQGLCHESKWNNAFDHISRRGYQGGADDQDAGSRRAHFQVYCAGRGERGRHGAGRGASSRSAPSEDGQGERAVRCSVLGGARTAVGACVVERAWGSRCCACFDWGLSHARLLLSSHGTASQPLCFLCPFSRSRCRKAAVPGMR